MIIENEFADNEKSEMEIGESQPETKDEATNEVEYENTDFSNFNKAELVKFLENLQISENYGKVNNVLKQVKNQFDTFVETERSQALQKFVENGGEEGDFELRKDDVVQKFDKVFEGLKDRIIHHFNNLEKEKDKNLATKEELLEKLRNLISLEETTTSIISLKDIQDEWKKIGPVPPNKSQGLWANYNALIERFYNNRSIYFELKELDRKKNLDSKKDIVDKSEKLVDVEPFTKAIKELKQLHEEYKHIGPVPKDDQESLWARFKIASDKIYEKRNAQLEVTRKQHEENFNSKQELVNRAEELRNFTSERIDEWKLKTAEILALQEEWKKAGGLAPEKAKEISKQFWAACKTYFYQKDQFFKKLEGKKIENLKLKQELCEKAELLKEDEDFGKTTNLLKDLQKQWESIGPVPIKEKDSIFKRFKAACDHFFSRKRGNALEEEKVYEENLLKKTAICESIEQLAASEAADITALKTFQVEYRAIGFVPRNEVNNVQKRYDKAISQFLAKMGGSIPESVEGNDKKELYEHRSGGTRNQRPSGGGNDKPLFKKESDIQRKMQALKSEIDQYSTNIEFLGHSSNAQKLKAEIQNKIDESKKELKALQVQLNIIKSS